MGNPNNPTTTEAFTTDDQPRFLVASQRYEQFLGSQADEIADVTKRAQLVGDLMNACSPLVGIAQNYEFIKATPELAGTQAETVMGQKLWQALSGPDIPGEVRDIYVDLYGQDIAQYAQPADV